jgi:hypothetical protein
MVTGYDDNVNDASAGPSALLNGVPQNDEGARASE